LTDWVKFLFIVLVVAVDDILREVASSFTTTRDFIRYRIRWIVVEKLRSLRRGANR
jgi:hypothetical protein